MAIFKPSLGTLFKALSGGAGDGTTMDWADWGRELNKGLAVDCWRNVFQAQLPRVEVGGEGLAMEPCDWRGSGRHFTAVNGEPCACYSSDDNPAEINHCRLCIRLLLGN